MARKPKAEGATPKPAKKGATPGKAQTTKAKGATPKPARNALERLQDRVGAPHKFTPAQIIQALEMSAGILLGAAQKLGCSHSTIRNYIDRFPEIAEALENIGDERLDVAETVVMQRLGDAKAPALQLKAAEFYLLTKGKHRGYSKQTVVTGKNNGPIQTQLLPPVDLSNLSEAELADLDKLLSKTGSSKPGGAPASP